MLSGHGSYSFLANVYRFMNIGKKRQITSQMKSLFFKRVILVIIINTCLNLYFWPRRPWTLNFLYLNRAFCLFLIVFYMCSLHNNINPRNFPFWMKLRGTVLILLLGYSNIYIFIVPTIIEINIQNNFLKNVNKTKQLKLIFKIIFLLK